MYYLQQKGMLFISLGRNVWFMNGDFCLDDKKFDGLWNIAAVQQDLVCQITRFLIFFDSDLASHMLQCQPVFCSPVLFIIESTIPLFVY